MTCTSDPNYKCGGPLINSVYKIKGPQTVVSSLNKGKDPVVTSLPTSEPSSVAPSFEPSSTPSREPSHIPSVKPSSFAPTYVPSSIYVYLGDYNDARFPNKALPKRFPNVGYTPYTCYTLSAANGYKYFGLQYGGECWYV